MASLSTDMSLTNTRMDHKAVLDGTIEKKEEEESNMLLYFHVNLHHRQKTTQIATSVRYVADVVVRRYSLLTNTSMDREKYGLLYKISVLWRQATRNKYQG